MEFLLEQGVVVGMSFLKVFKTGRALLQVVGIVGIVKSQDSRRTTVSQRFPRANQTTLCIWKDVELDIAAHTRGQRIRGLRMFPEPCEIPELCTNLSRS